MFYNINSSPYQGFYGAAAPARTGFDASQVGQLGSSPYMGSNGFGVANSISATPMFSGGMGQQDVNGMLMQLMSTMLTLLQQLFQGGNTFSLGGANPGAQPGGGTTGNAGGAGNGGSNTPVPDAPATPSTQTQTPVYTPPAYNGGSNTPVPGTPATPSTQTQTPVYTPPAYNGGKGAMYWSDPHLVGFDGEKYDVMGQPGKTYSMLSDQNLQYNTKFEKWGEGGATAISQVGLQVGPHQVYFDRSGHPPKVNGEPMQVGQTLRDQNGSATWDGNRLIVNTKEYAIDMQVKEPTHPNGGYIDSNVKINDVGPFSDFVAPHGLLGQTADGIAGEKSTGIDQGKQGGTAIDGTVADYEVSGLWTADSKFNRFGAQVGQIKAGTDGQVTQVLDTKGNVILKTATPTAP